MLNIGVIYVTNIMIGCLIMNNFLVLIYFTFFAVIAGGAFAMMWSNIQSINNPRKPQHPEAPKEGDELLYVDLNRDRLENLYKNSQDKK